MRTTLNLDDDVMTRAKILAIRRKTTLSKLIEDAVRDVLDAETRADRNQIDLPVSSGAPLPADFPWHSGSRMIEYIEGASAPR